VKVTSASVFSRCAILSASIASALGREPLIMTASRREFLQSSVAASAALALGQKVLAAQSDAGKGVPQRPLGRTGVPVSIVCLGGWHIGEAAKDDGEAAAIKLMHRALSEGVTFFDNCWDYHDGLSE